MLERERLLLEQFSPVVLHRLDDTGYLRSGQPTK
jgi:hypothetical protein